MSLEKFEILLDEPSMQYKPGQLVSGKLVIKADAEVKCEELTLKFKGEADVRITSGTGDDVDTFKDSEEFFNFHKRWMGDGETEICISPGEELLFALSFQLPSLPLPASFKGSHGKVKYALEGEVKRSFWKWNHTTLQPITILGELDQQHVSEAKLPSEVKTSKTFGFWCFSSGPLSLHVRVPVRGAAAGGTIHFEVEVNNMSRKRIIDLTARILQKVEFTAKHLRREMTTSTHASFNEIRRGDGVFPGACETWREALVVPSVPPTNLGAGCRFIDVRYFILVTAHVADLMAINLTAMCPIVIGI